MEPNIESRLAILEEKVDKIYVSTEKTRKYFLWTLITSVVLFVLPLLGVVLILPTFFSNYVGSIQTLSQ